MKKIILLAGLAMSICASFNSQAQVHINVQLGLPVARQPWYANDNDYYYMPEQGVYYNVRRKVYVYPEGGAWLTAERLPSRYGSYSYRSSHYVRVNDRSPFNRDNDYRQRYHGGDRAYHSGHGRGHWDDNSNDRRNDYNRGNDNNRGNEHNDRGNDNNHGNDRGNRGNDNGTPRR